jgi:hypothetical protein
MAVWARRIRQVAGRLAEVGQMHLAAKELANLVAILVQRRDNDV